MAMFELCFSLQENRLIEESLLPSVEIEDYARMLETVSTRIFRLSD